MRLLDYWKHTKFVFFFEKIDGFFQKNTWIFFKIVKGGKFALEGVSNNIIA